MRLDILLIRSGATKEIVVILFQFLTVLNNELIFGWFLDFNEKKSLTIFLFTLNKINHWDQIRWLTKNKYNENKYIKTSSKYQCYWAYEKRFQRFDF